MSTSYFGVREHIIPCSYIREYPGALLNNQEDTLRLHVKQYTPLDGSQHRPGAITIVGAHANAFPKELYEALWDDLYEALKERGESIAGIWISDVAHQGLSGVLNEDKIGNDRSPAPEDNKASWLLSQKSTIRRDKWPSRAEAKTAFLRSKFYQIWDPRVLDLLVKYGLRNLPTALYPRDPNDPDQTKDTSADDSPVTLTTSKHQEVFTFLRPIFGGVDARGKKMPNRQTHPDLDPDLDPSGQVPFYRPEPTRTFHILQYLRPSALYIFGGQSLLSPADMRKAKMERTGTGVGGSGGAKEGKVKEKLFEEKGHLLPMEIPRECADAAAGFLASSLEEWRAEEEAWRKDWEGKSKAERSTVSEDWKRNLGGEQRVKSSQKL
ncbi:hypothetical protein P7C71_g2854, partial [Lecanoromycetidae sp. Uapishka_2]